MAISMTAPVAEAQVAAKVGELSPELQFLLDGADVSSGIQAKISECGILSVDVFAKIEDDIAGFRAFVKRDLTMDPAVSTQNRVATAKLINAWETAQVRGKKRREEEAELRVGDLLLKLPRTTHLDLRKSFTTKHKELTKEQTPHPDYLVARLQQLEKAKSARRSSPRLCPLLTTTVPLTAVFLFFLMASSGRKGLQPRKVLCRPTRRSTGRRSRSLPGRGSLSA